MNLLFTNAGRRAYLIEDALDLAHGTDFELGVFVCDTSPATASMLVSPEIKTFLTPRVSDDPERYVEVLIEECRKRNIGMIIPLMDFELPILAGKLGEFRAAGINIVVSAPDVISTTLDKEKCCIFCAEKGLSMPRTWFAGDGTANTQLPLVLKRTFGSGSVDLVVIKESTQIPEIVPSGFILQEMVVGEEYGMDILNDFDGEFIHCCARRKIAMRAGETDKAEVVYEERFQELGKTVSAAFRHTGNLDLDFIVDSAGKITFLDFNPRFGGGYPFTRAAGFDYLRTLLELAHGKEPRLPKHGRKIIGAKVLRLYTMEREG